MGAAESILLSLLATLSLGGYGYSYLQGRDIRRELGKIWEQITNHQEHRFQDIERRMSALESPRPGTAEKQDDAS